MQRALSLMAFVGLLLLTQGAYAGTYVRTSQMNYPIYTQDIYLNSVYTYEFEIKDLKTLPGCTSFPDTYMRLLKDGNEVARNDDGGAGYASKINYSPPYSFFPQSAWYKLVVHSFSTSRCGSMDLHFNGYPIANDVPYGGVTEYFTNVNQGDKFETAFQSGGGYGYTMLVNSAGAAGPMLKYQDRSDTGAEQGRKSKLSYTAPTSGSNTYGVVYSAKYSMDNENVGIVHNPSLDFDGDGLGNALELELGTCPDATATVQG